MGGSSSGKGSTTATSSPSPQAMQSYTGLMSRANQLSMQKYDPYTGQLVADLTPQQQTAFQQYGNAYGSAQPYIDQASQYARLGSSPIQASAIQNYLNPYQQDVIGATEAQMRNVDQAQLSQVMGQGMGSGGLLNDRLGVAQGQVANQQALANNQTLAGLNVTNYNQALAAAQADRAAAAQGAYTFGNLGQENLQSILAGAGANLTAGQLQQQQQQNVLNSTYGQWQQAKAYPYQQIAWAAGIDTGLGSNMGGTSTTTPPAANTYAPYVGAGLTAAGLYQNSQNPQKSQRGGAIRGFDDGGSVTPYGGSGGYIPAVPNLTHGSGPPKPPSPPQQGGSGKDQGLGGIFGGATQGDLSKGLSGLGSLGSSAASSFGEAFPEAGATLADALPLMMLERGGRIDVGQPRGLEWGHVRGYAEGGAPYNAVPAAVPGLMDEPEDPDAPRSLGSVPLNGTDPEAFSSHRLTGERPNPLEGGYTLADMGPGTGFPFNPDRTDAAPAYDNPDLRTPDGLHAPLEGPPGAPGRPAGKTLASMAPGVGLGPDIEPAASAEGLSSRTKDNARITPEGGVDARPVAQPPHKSSGLGNALMAAGLSMMANRSPYFGQAVGDAGLAGLSAYTGTQRHEEQQQHLAAKEKLSQANQDRMLKALEEKAARDDREFKLKSAQLTKPHLTTDARGNPILVDPSTGKATPVESPAPTRAPAGPVPVEASTSPGAGAPAAPARPNNGLEGVLSADASGATVPPPRVHPEALEGLTPAEANTVRAIAEGRRQFLPVGRNNKVNQFIMDKVQEYDPDADQTMYGKRSRTANFFAVGTNGGGGQNIAAMNTWAQHASKLYDLSEKLGNGRFTSLNQLTNYLAQHGYTSKETQDLLGQLDVVTEAVATEGAKAFAGTNGALADREEWRKRLGTDNPASVTKEKLRAAVDLIEGRLAALAGQYNEGMRTNHEPYEFLQPATRQRLLKLKAGEGGGNKESNLRPPNEAETVAAREAIGRGVSRNAVIQRLQQHGISAQGL